MLDGQCKLAHLLIKTVDYHHFEKPDVEQHMHSYGFWQHHEDTLIPGLD